MPKIAAIVQGNVREGTLEIIEELSRHFDHVILSAWEADRDKAPVGDYVRIFNKRPANEGATNRNLQRWSTCSGLRSAAELNCEFVLKWRTDLLPIKLDREALLGWAHHATPAGFPSRLVMCPFRQLSVTPDWFSSFPDFFAFGHIEMVRLLWEAPGFDFELPLNVPPGMRSLPGFAIRQNRLFLNDIDVTISYNAHNECYAWFKENLQKQIQREITHREVVREFLALPDHRRWRICWFGDRRFRAINQASDLGWLSERQWRTDQLPAPRPLTLLNGTVPSFLGQLRNTFVTKWEIFLQKLWWRAYRRRRKFGRRAS